MSPKLLRSPTWFLDKPLISPKNKDKAGQCLMSRNWGLISSRPEMNWQYPGCPGLCAFTEQGTAVQAWALRSEESLISILIYVAARTGQSGPQRARI